MGIEASLLKRYREQLEFGILKVRAALAGDDAAGTAFDRLHQLYMDTEKLLMGRVFTYRVGDEGRESVFVGSLPVK